ncbi:MAG: GNAT family N-acetyltransferase [Anaerolineales bacterium]|nr:GNAT family N-acetyltransferase [Anaerolineales bacterium]
MDRSKEFALSTPRLILRPLRSEDAETMYRYRSRPDVSRYQVWRPADEAEVRAFIEKLKGLAPGVRGTWFSMAMTLRENGLMIGDVGMHFPETESTQVEAGITLSPAFRRRGLAAEALREVCRFAFETMGKDRVYASVDPRNKPSIRLLERIGMRKEVFMPASMVIRGELVDDAIYAVRKADFRPGGAGRS